MSKNHEPALPLPGEDLVDWKQGGLHLPPSVSSEKSPEPAAEKTPREKALDLFMMRVRRALPNIDNHLAAELRHFLLAKPFPAYVESQSSQEKEELPALTVQRYPSRTLLGLASSEEMPLALQRNREAYTIAGRLVEAGFGQALHPRAAKEILGNHTAAQQPILNSATLVEPLALMLLQAPSFTNPATRLMFDTQFSEWKESFMAAMQNRPPNLPSYA